LVNKVECGLAGGKREGEGRFFNPRSPQKNNQ